MSDSIVPPVDGSLDGVIVASTAIAQVDGRKGLAIVRGYPLPDLARRCTYEQVAHLVLHGQLPNEAERRRFESSLRSSATLTDDDDRVIRAFGKSRSRADTLVAAVILADDRAAQAMADPRARAERVLGRIPSVCAAVAGVAVPPADASYARRSLAALGSQRTDAASIRALEVLLALEAEHGFSASTFACRVAGSSGAGAGVSLAAAVATLSGPRHGGATAQAHALLERAAASGDPAAFLRDAYARRERLPGFGHRVYKVADPRVPPLREAMHAMGDARLLATTEVLESTAAPLYGAKGVHANIDLYGAALLDALGVAPSEYIAAFALGIVCGWLAHWCEQGASGRLVRPDAQYTGPPLRPVP